MNEEYLWNKTGNDAEIENFENALAVFRYKENAAPSLQPAKVVPFKREKRGRVLKFAFAVAACLGLAVVSLGVWLQISADKISNETNLADTKTVQEKIPQPVDSNVSQPEETTADNIAASPRQTVKRKFIKANKIAPAISYQQKTVAKNYKSPKQTEVNLTKEEKYAYNQLMLALSITSSKLRIVKDKIENTEQTKDLNTEAQ
jgi:hypothetical protein